MVVYNLPVLIKKTVLKNKHISPVLPCQYVLCEVKVRQGNSFSWIYNWEVTLTLKKQTSVDFLGWKAVVVTQLFEKLLRRRNLYLEQTFFHCDGYKLVWTAINWTRKLLQWVDEQMLLFQQTTDSQWIPWTIILALMELVHKRWVNRLCVYISS